MVESIDPATQTAAYAAMLSMAETADKYYSYLEDQKSESASKRESALSAINPENYATNYAYQKALASVPKYAGGGFAEGWGVAGESGAELINFGRGARVYSNKETKSILNTDELLAEIKKLRAEQGENGLANAANTAKMAEILRRWHGDGMPTTREGQFTMGYLL
jgi:hypothetical protein